MEVYYGVKVIQAHHIRSDLDKTDHPDGYWTDNEGWLSKPEFEKVYRKSGELSFSHALEAAKRGHRIARSGWQLAFVYLQNSKRMDVSGPLLEVYAQGTEISTGSYLHIHSAPGVIYPYSPAMKDLMADDWVVLA